MGRIDLAGIKTNIKSILDTANTTTASPLDLSDSLTTRVNKVLKVNVEKIPIQPSFFPCITMFYDSKSVELEDISRTMLQGKKKATITMNVVGILWHDDLSNASFDLVDPADDELEQLMENIEQVLRNDPTLSNSVLYSVPTNISYHSFPVQEGSLMRTGIMSFKVVVYY